MGGLGEAWALMARMEILLPRILSIMKKMHITVTDAMHIFNITDKGDQEYIIDHLKYTDIVQQSFQKQNMKLERIRIGDRDLPIRIDYNVIEEIEEEYETLEKFRMELLGFKWKRGDDGKYILVFLFRF